MLISTKREPAASLLVCVIEMQRYIPLAVIVLVLLSLAAYFGPPFYRGYLFRRDCNGMLSAALAGKLSAVTAALEPQQQQPVALLFQQFLPPDYNKSLDSLKLTRYEESESGKIWAYVIARIDQGGSVGIYEGRLHWLYTGKSWVWDFNSSYGAPFSTSGEQQNWVKLGDLLPLAGQL